MRYEDALLLKKGDLVVISGKPNKSYEGMVLEIDSINPEHDNWCCRVTLKQPGFDNGFRLNDYDTRRLQRYES